MRKVSEVSVAELRGKQMMQAVTIDSLENVMINNKMLNLHPHHSFAFKKYNKIKKYIYMVFKKKKIGIQN